MHVFRIAILLFGIIYFANPLFTQWLLGGKFHPNREREIDILHYLADIKLDVDNRKLAGFATIRFTPLSQRDEFSLDAIRLVIISIRLNNNQELQFELSNNKLNISLDRPYSSSDTLEIEILYEAQPNAGLYFSIDPDHPGQYFIHTYGEGGLHANWLPIYNNIDDKFSVEILATVPHPYTAISNGKLLATNEMENNYIQYHWRQQLPIANYLIALYIGEFEHGDLPSAANGTPVGFWVPKGRTAEGARAFHNTPKMMDFFSEIFDYPYPWEKYDQVVVPDYSVGGMEHNTVSGFKMSALRNEDAPAVMGLDFERYHYLWSMEGICSHELAHHWIGNNVTCRNLNYLWLNESFATYCQMLWERELFGEEMLLLDKQEAFDRYLQYREQRHIIRPLEYPYYDTIGETYNINITYFKGAAVMHMLRFILGDEDFFRVLRYYMHKYQFANVETDHFRLAIEEVTGKNLHWFFEDWIYGGGHPIFEVRYSYLPKHHLIDLSVKQVQPVIEGQDLFTLPVEITIAHTNGVQKERIWIKHRSQRFLLSCPEKPLMVSFDGRGALVAEIRFSKSLDELIYQLHHDEFLGRFWALREIARRFPVHPKSVQALSDIISSQSFWGLKAEAALLLGEIRTTEAEKVVRLALKAPEYRIRKAAVLALPQFRTDFAVSTLKQVITNDPQTDVVATAIVALAKTDPLNQIDFIKRQMNRPAWCDEINIACLKAFEINGDKSLVPCIKPYMDHRYIQHVREAAMYAWQSCDPNDPQLHNILIHFAKQAPLGIQFAAVALLGELHVTRAIFVLQDISAHSGDSDLAADAESAIAEIERINKNRIH